MQVGEAGLQDCEPSLTGDPDQISEYQNAESNANSKNKAQDISVWKKDTTDIWTIDNVWYAVVKNLSAFCLCTETLRED